MTRTPHLRRSAFAAPALLAALALAGCASDGPTRPELPDRPSVERPEGLVPDGVSEMREGLADRRAASRDLMDTTLIQPAKLETHEPPSGPGVLGFLNNVGNTALDILSLRTLGLW